MSHPIGQNREDDWCLVATFTNLHQQKELEAHAESKGRQAMIRSNSLEDILCASQKQRRRSNFVERKDGSTTGSMSLTDDTVSSWSCSTPGSGGK